MATVPFFGIEPCIVNDEGKELEGVCTGNLCIKRSWPGQMMGVYGDPERMFNTYFAQFPGKYFTGDGCRRDKDATIRSPAALTTLSTFPDTVWVPRKWNRPSFRTRTSPSPLLSVIRTRSRASRSTLS